MAIDVLIRIPQGDEFVVLAGTLQVTGPDAMSTFEHAGEMPDARLLLAGDRDFLVALRERVTRRILTVLERRLGSHVQVQFPGRFPLRRVLRGFTAGPMAEEPAAPVAKGPAEPVAKGPEGPDIPVVPPAKQAPVDSGSKPSADTPPAPVAPVAPAAPAAPPQASLDLTEGRSGAAPLWLLPNGCFAVSPDAPAMGMEAVDALIAAARWISSRRSSTFERLFPPSAFHPELPIRQEKMSVAQAGSLLEQVRSVLRAASVGGREAQQDSQRAGEARSAALTILSHMIATAFKDSSWREIADASTAEAFAAIEAERGETAIAALRAHAIHLLGLRGPALRPDAQQQATKLLRSILREAPPYQELSGAWRFAMCSAPDFHEGECEILLQRYGFHEVPAPADAPGVSVRFGDASYRVFEASFRTPSGNPIQIFARSAYPEDENTEMGYAYFAGMLINRHAQLGSYDLKATALRVRQQGYKLMMNSQCAGLTTRFAISRLFPDADIYSSWDSTYFRMEGGKVSASEGLDCFVAMLTGMSRGETHSQIDQRMRGVQWHHSQSAVPGFSQFIGPAHELVVARMSDINQDGRADLYDGYLDLRLADVAENLWASATARDPGVATSQISGEAAVGLNWAAGSMNRVAQYSDVWAALPGDTELFYAFQSAGFYSHKEPPADVPQGKFAQDLGRLPAVCRYIQKSEGKTSFVAEVMLHSHLSHAGKEYKRLLCAAESMWRAFDLGYFASDPLLVPVVNQRCAVLLMLAGLLEFPSDQNWIDGLWSTALKTLNFPEVSRTVVRGCITEEDHHASNYYGSRRGIRQLQETLEKGDPVIWERFKSAEPQVGRAGPMDFG